MRRGLLCCLTAALFAAVGCGSGSETERSGARTAAAAPRAAATPAESAATSAVTVPAARTTPRRGSAGERSAAKARAVNKAMPTRTADARACSVSKLKAALSDPRVNAAQRAQIRVALAVAASAGDQATCLTPPPGGPGKPAPAPAVRKGCRVSDLAAAADNPALAASVRAQARQRLAAVRKAGITNLCTAAAPAAGQPAAKPGSGKLRTCSIEQYRRALQDPRLTSAQKQRLRQYVELLEAQDQTRIYC